MSILNTKLQCKEDNPGVNIMPPLIFYICFITGGVLEFIFPTSFSIFTLPVGMGIGILMGLSGFIFMMFAHEKFKTLGTKVHTNQEATQCVVHGAYQFSRNPMYVGGSLFFLAMGVIAGSVWMLISYLPLGIYLSFYVVPKEEAYMERSFGSKYQAYCQKVRRWI